MPRLTAPDYYSHHTALREAWAAGTGVFSFLTAKQQQDLHRYYRPTDPGTKEELLAYRREMTALDPSLPQRAGRALAALRQVPEPTDADALSTGVGLPRRRKGPIYIRPVYKPKVDVRVLILALMEFMKSLESKERESVAREDRQSQKGEPV